MKEFISFLISFILMGVADNIDSAFNNLLSIDASWYVEVYFR